MLKKSLSLFLGLCFLAGAAYWALSKNANEAVVFESETAEKNQPAIVEEAPSAGENKSEKISENETPEVKDEAPVKLPDKILIDVPFTSQAPFSVWDAYHEDACEEAAIIMVKYYLDKKPLSRETAEKEIQAMIKFELEKYGDYKSSTAEGIVRLAREFYGIDNLKAVYDIRKEDIKKYLAKGQPIIAPAAGRLLGNPNFTAPGPLYHNLVLIGYDGDTIITNDPGTRKGKGYTYSLDILYEAIHDFPGQPENIKKGRKALIVLEQ